MTFLRVFLWMQGINIILMVCPITFQISFQDRLHLRIGYLFFHYTLKPPRPKEKEPGKKKAAGQSLREKLGSLYHEKGLSGLLTLLGELAKIAGGLAKGIFPHLVFSHFWLKIGVSGSNAANTAVRYGSVCGAVSTAVGAILGKAKCKTCRIQIDPDFQSGKSSAKFDAKARILPFFLINALLRALFRSFKLIKSAAAIHNN